MLGTFYSWYLKKSPKIKGWLFKNIFSPPNLKIGTRFQCDTFPRVQITDNASIQIGDNVTFRRDVELRAHQNSQLKIGRQCQIDRGVRILSTNSSRIKIGDRTKVGLYTVINGGDSVSVGSNCLISGFVYLQTSMHRHEREKFIQNQGYDHASIFLGEDVWIGTHAVIMPGTTLNDGVVVGSNAVVTKSVQAGEIVGGVPARVLKKRG